MGNEVMNSKRVRSSEVLLELNYHPFLSLPSFELTTDTFFWDSLSISDLILNRVAFKTKNWQCICGRNNFKTIKENQNKIVGFFSKLMNSLGQKNIILFSCSILYSNNKVKIVLPHPNSLISLSNDERNEYKNWVDFQCNNIEKFHAKYF